MGAVLILKQPFFVSPRVPEKKGRPFLGKRVLLFRKRGVPFIQKEYPVLQLLILTGNRTAPLILPGFESRPHGVK
jgi:hypothetical protein